MKILAVADVEDRALGEHFDPERWRGVDLVLSLGDLKPDYLDYLVSRLNVPCFYVRGNHDTTYDKDPPPGGVNLHDHVEKFKGVRFFGLEGSYWYNGGPAQYTESEMWWKAFWARLTLMQSGGAGGAVSSAGRTSSTGHGALWTISSAIAPGKRRERPPRMLVPMMIKSTPCSRATPTTVCATAP